MSAQAVLQFMSKRVGGGCGRERSSDGPSTPLLHRRGEANGETKAVNAKEEGLPLKLGELAGGKRPKAIAKNKLQKEKEQEEEESVQTKVVRTGCVYFLKGLCTRGSSCPYAHVESGPRREPSAQADLAKAQSLASSSELRRHHSDQTPSSPPGRYSISAKGEDKAEPPRSKDKEKRDLNDEEELPRRMTIEYDAEDEHDLESGGSESDEAAGLSDEEGELKKDHASNEAEEEEEKKDFFEMMPPELVWLVAGWLEHQELARLASTCHRMADLVSDPLLWKLNYARAWGPNDQSTSSSGGQSASSTLTCDNSAEVNSEPLGGEEERGKEIGEGMRGGPLADDVSDGSASSPEVDRESGSEDEGGGPDRRRHLHPSRVDKKKNESDEDEEDDERVRVDVEVMSANAGATPVERDWRAEYRSRLEYEHRGWKAKNIQRLSKKVTNVETHHNATFITSLLVNRPSSLEPARMTKVKASCFVLVVDRMTSSLHRKDDNLAIAPNWELDNGIVRVIEMKSYKKKKTIIIKPHHIASPLLARFSSAYGDGRIAIAPQHQPGSVELWDWANDSMLHQFTVSCNASAMDFCYNDVALGDASGPVSIYDVRQGGRAPTSVLRGHSDKVTCMQRRGEVLATGSGDGTVRIWDLRKRSAPLFQLEGHSISFVSSLQFDSQKLIFSAVHSPPNQYFWQNAKNRNPFRYQMLHVWNGRTFEFWNSLDFSKECVEATSPMSFDFEGNFLVVGVPRQVVMLNFYNNAHCG